MYNSIKISIVIPCYNAANKIHRCIQSLEKIQFPKNDYEVIFIDDFSSDSTKNILENQVKKHTNWILHTLKKNSGSPSKPRNEGILVAKGEYIFFLDADDEIIAESLPILYELARKEQACVVRASLIVNNNGERILRNQIKRFSKHVDKQKKIKEIIRYQSTTPPSLIKTKLLKEKNILWDENIRMGEDTLFLIDVLQAAKTISYHDEPIYIYNKSVRGGEASSTQVYGQRELKNHLTVWESAEEKLKRSGFSYFKVRGEIALRTVFQAIMQFYQGDISAELFNQFSIFINKHPKAIKNINISKRFEISLRHLQKNEYHAFFDSLKPRLLIVGTDLKFIHALIPDLNKFYKVKIDEWTGHDSHDEKQSQELLNWADVIFCEWLLGNAVWYSKHKKKHQKLIIRMHRFELTRDFGYQVIDENVDWYCTVGLYIFEKMLETFHYKRGKVRLIPNFIETEHYQTSSNMDKVFNIGIVGILPSRKGYLTALKLLNQLLQKDKRYNLSVFGKMPEELPWVINDKKEKTYFQKCNNYIKAHKLAGNVAIKGWVDTKEALKDIGFVLSVSSNEELVESFHIAPAEAFASANQGVFLHWDGVNYLYPENYIFQTLSDLSDYIIANNDTEIFNKNVLLGQSFVQDNYNKDNFIESFKQMVQEDYQ